MPKQMSGKTFSTLLDYYIACLEQEDMLSVTFPISSEGTQFVSTPLTHEELFHTNGVKVTLNDSLAAQRFFQTSLPRQKQKTLFYGYPLMVCPEGKLSPVFSQEVSYERRNDSIILSPTTGIEPRLNPYIFSQNGFSNEEIIHIKQDVEAQEIERALSSVCELFHAEPGLFSATFDQKPLKHTITPTLVNKAILYFGERTGITHNLIVVLRQLQRKPLDDLASTSLFLLIAQTLHPEKNLDNTIPMLEVFLLNPAQKQAIQQALSKSLTVITGPPGTGKSQVVLNIIANAVYQKKTVLFASKNNKAVDVVIDKFHAMLPFKLIVRMGHRTHRKNAKTELTQLIKEHITPRTLPRQTISDLWTCSSQLQAIQDDLTRLSTLNQQIDALQRTIDETTDKFPEDVYEEIRQYNLDKIDSYALMKDITKHFDHQGFFHRLGGQRYQRYDYAMDFQLEKN
jgi:hypothetical protein